jgi:putative hemolysin
MKPAFKAGILLAGYFMEQPHFFMDSSLTTGSLSLHGPLIVSSSDENFAGGVSLTLGFIIGVLLVQASLVGLLKASERMGLEGLDSLTRRALFSGSVMKNVESRICLFRRVTQIGMVVCALILGALAFGPFHHLLVMPGLGYALEMPPVALEAFGLVITLGCLLLGVIVLGTILPRRMGEAFPESTLFFAPGLVKFSSLVLIPLVLVGEKLSHWVMRVLGTDQDEYGMRRGADVVRGEAELKRLIEWARLDGIVPESRLQLFEKIRVFSQTFVRQVMVPRVEVAFFDRRKSLAANLDLAKRTAHSRYPLVDGSLDQVRGVVHMKDLFWTINDLGVAGVDSSQAVVSNRHPALAGSDVLVSMPSNGADFLSAIARDVLFVPETMRLDSLLKEFQTRRVHMAMVIDEFGGVSGLVTFENVIEEIVGEVQDEFDMEQPLVKRLSDREFMLDGITPLDVANEALGVNLSSEEADTIGGLLSSELGRLPTTGEVVSLNGIEFVVREVRKLRVQRVLARVGGVSTTEEGNSEEGA